MKNLLVLLILLPTIHPAARAQKPLRYRDWQLVLLEDFDTYRDVADLQARSPWKLTPDTYRTLINNPHESEYYDPRNVELHEGNLHLIARPLPEPLQYRYSVAGRDTMKLLRYESGWLNLKAEFRANEALGDTARWAGNRGFQYGLFEIRCRQGGGAGTWPAFWLYSGPTEIDVFEGGLPQRFSNNLHYRPAQQPPQQLMRDFTHARQPDLEQGFHTYSVVWTKEAVTFYLDRKWLRTVPAAQVPSYPAPADIIANQAVVDYATPATWPAGTPERRESHLVIDYIKVYKRRADLPAARR
jgi:Glycosyl hydrolases family 16